MMDEAPDSRVIKRYVWRQQWVLSIHTPLSPHYFNRSQIQETRSNQQYRIWQCEKKATGISFQNQKNRRHRQKRGVEGQKGSKKKNQDRKRLFLYPLPSQPFLPDGEPSKGPSANAKQATATLLISNSQ